MTHFVHCKAGCGHYSTTGATWYCSGCYKKAAKHMNHEIIQCRECGYGYPIIEGVHCRCPNCDQPDATAKEQVNHPKHYQATNDPDGVYEVIKVLEAWFPDEQSEAFCLCNAIKYIARAGKKTPDKLEDLKKAQWYLNRVIENLKIHEGDSVNVRSYETSRSNRKENAQQGKGSETSAASQTDQTSAQAHESQKQIHQRFQI